METDVRDRLDEARALHRAGRREAARAAYEALLPEAPGDPDLLGLVGVLELQCGQPRAAEDLLRRALGMKAETRIRLRNLNNLLLLLRETGQDAAGRDLAAGADADWPLPVPAGADDRRTVLSLAEALTGFGEPGKARRLLDAAVPDRDGDPVALNLEGRLLLAAGDAAGAIAPLTRAAALAPDDCHPVIALAAAEESAGDKAAAQATMRRIAAGWPVHSEPAHPDQQAEILVLNPPPTRVIAVNGGLSGLHFHGNYPSEVAQLLGSRFRLHSLLTDPPDLAPPEALPTAASGARLVWNNVVNAELMNVPGRLRALEALVARLGLPVLNAPAQVFATTRQKNAALLAGIPGLKVPRIERYRGDLAGPEAIAADIAGKFDFPVILRKTMAHETTDALLPGQTDVSVVLLPDRVALEAHLDACPWGEFYAVEYVDLRRPDGFFRKLRAVMVGDAVILAQAAMYRDWLVAGWRGRPEGQEFYRANPHTMAECNRIVLDPEAELGPEVLRVLAAIRARIPLDMFGVDFDVDAKGRVVFFEAGAAMLLHVKNDRAPPDVRLPVAPFERIDNAFAALVAARAGGAAGRSGAGS